MNNRVKFVSFYNGYSEKWKLIIDGEKIKEEFLSAKDAIEFSDNWCRDHPTENADTTLEERITSLELEIKTLQDTVDRLKVKTNHLWRRR